MSIYTDAQVHVLLSDFANSDVAGKVNVIGGGISLMGQGPNGHTAPFSVTVMTSVPATYAGQQYSLSLELYDETRGKVVEAPSPAGKVEAMRVQQVIDVQPVILGPGLKVPRDVQSQNVTIMNFPGGMPLQPGTYDWRAQVDGQKRPGWKARFHVLEAAQGPIFGGPVGPSDISGIAQPFSPVDTGSAD